MIFKQAIRLNKNGTLQKKSDTNEWIVTDEFVWFLNYELKANAPHVIVKKGFEHDFGSIPRIFWFLFNPTKYVSYILHDWLYTHRTVKLLNNVYLAIERKEADDILYQALKVEGMPTYKAFLVYISVRLFGGFYRKKNGI